MKNFRRGRREFSHQENPKREKTQKKKDLILRSYDSKRFHLDVLEGDLKGHA